MPSKWIDRLTPTNPLNGNTNQLPAKPPTLIKLMTNDVCCLVKGPVASVVFSFSSSSKFIVAQPVDSPNDSVNKLPKLQMVSNIYLNIP